MASGMAATRLDPRSLLFASQSNTECLILDEPAFEAPDMHTCLGLLQGSRELFLRGAPENEIVDYASRSYVTSKHGEVDTSVPYIYHVVIPPALEELDAAEFTKALKLKAHPFLDVGRSLGELGVDPVGGSPEHMMWTLMQSAAQKTHPSGYTWTSWDRFDSRVATATNEDEGTSHRKDYVSTILGTRSGDMWVSVCGFTETDVLAAFDCRPDPATHLFHVLDAAECFKITQTARQVQLSEGAVAMREYLQSTFAYEGGAVITPYAWAHLIPANLSISVDEYTFNSEFVAHPFLEPGPFNTTFTGSQYAQMELELANAQTKLEGYVWTSHNKFGTTKAEALPDADQIEAINTRGGAGHYKEYISILLDGTAGTEYEGRRFVVPCGFAEFGELGPTEAAK